MKKYNLEYLSQALRKEAEAKLSHKPLSTERLNIMALNGAYLLPVPQKYGGGVLSSYGNSVQSTAGLADKQIYDFEKEKVIKKNKAILIGTFWGFVFGHCFTDHFDKLWVLQTDEYRNLIDEEVELVYIAPKELPHYFKELLLLAGLDVSKTRRVVDVELYETLYLPELSFYALVHSEKFYYTEEYWQTIELVKQNAAIRVNNKKTFDKIYLTRTQNSSGKAKEIGERRIEKFFENRGYKVIAPEKFSIVEQIWLMMNCKELATTEGSIGHLSVFCESGTNVILLNKCNKLIPHQICINDCAHLNVTYITVHKSSLIDKNAYWAGPFFLYVSKQLKSYFNDHSVTFHLLLDIFYLKYIIKFGFRKIYIHSIAKIGFIQRLAHRIVHK